jgi:hypothetical protein
LKGILNPLSFILPNTEVFCPPPAIITAFRPNNPQSSAAITFPTIAAVHPNKPRSSEYINSAARHGLSIRIVLLLTHLADLDEVVPAVLGTYYSRCHPDRLALWETDRAIVTIKDIGSSSTPVYCVVDLFPARIPGPTIQGGRVAIPDRMEFQRAPMPVRLVLAHLAKPVVVRGRVFEKNHLNKPSRNLMFLCASFMRVGC